MPSRSPAPITFYDELGVAQNAASEEIRDSFRALVRILHPDHQTDVQLKEIAERQMRKLNGIYAVLSDPEKRRRYDEGLEGENVGPTIILSPTSTINIQRLRERMAWVVALCVAIGVMVWLSSDNPSAVPSQPFAERSLKKSTAAAPSVTVSTDELAQMRSDLNLMRMERDAAIHELTRLRSASSKGTKTWTQVEPAPFSSFTPPTAATELPAPVLPAPLPSGPSSVRMGAQKPPSATGSQDKPFAGFWFYNKPSGSQRGKPSSLYPPEFIETTITEQNGIVHGRYRSRYKIVDRAISPDVSFEFSGTATGSTVVCPWTGPGGSKGELTLKMAGENALMVDWTATELGSIQGLITGTATLTRRID